LILTASRYPQIVNLDDDAGFQLASLVQPLYGRDK